MLNLKLDTTSEYIMSVEDYPKEVCNVMVDFEDDEQYKSLLQLFESIKGDAPEYVDGYAFIDPETKTVNRFQFIATFSDDDKRYMDVFEAEDSDRIRYYKMFEDVGGEDFKEFISDSIKELRAQQARNMINSINSHNSLLLDKCGIYPDMISMDELADIIKTPTCKIKERLNALFAYAMKYSVEDNLDELDFYRDLIEEFDERELWLSDNKEAVGHAITFMDEHGLLSN